MGKRISYCVLFDSKRSKALSWIKALKIQKLMDANGLNSVIVEYSQVKRLPIYSAIDLHAGFCSF